MDIKINNLIKNAKSTPTLSKFLTLEEQKLLSDKDLTIQFSQSYENEERKRAFLHLKTQDIYPDFKISILKITSNDKLKHPDILGALMGLGITREVIGDIITGDDNYVVVANEIVKYVIDNLLQVNKNTVQVEKVDKIVTDIENNYLKTNIIIPSLRLDAVLSKGLFLSREKAQDLISMKAVKINGKIIGDNDYQCQENDIVSITKFGRIIIRDIARTTKKDKIVLNIERTK